MNRTAIRTLISIASVLLAGLIITQVTWVRKAYVIEEKQFSYDVTQVLMNVVKLIQLNAGDSIPIYDPVEQASPNYFVVSIHDTLHPYYLEALLKTEFRKSEVNDEFEYNIYDCFTDSVVYQKSVSYGSDTNDTAEDMPVISWDNDDGHYFSVYFHDRNTNFFERMGFWLYSSLFIVIVVAFFIYTISIILKQKRLSEMKTDFINNMTHEFKTPISTIALSSEVLKEPEKLAPERLKNYANIIRQENQRLQSQVERILQIATIEREQIKLTRKPVDMNQVVEKAAETFHLNVQAKGGTLEVQTDATQSTVEGDEVHLLNIICNLVDNAIKYTSTDPSIRIVTENSDFGIRIRVEDNGIGISPSEQKHIFDKFYRIPSGNRHDVKGFGIGLNYVKVMVDRHGGRIRLQSEPGKGSVFTIELPVT